ncbi:MAG: type II toxin-antitoxin system VapC family toxin [Crenarchaeota archaeon]|nr:type II toxin-antitoxin system VapC family toxin [Thermoproteota archaeon]
MRYVFDASAIINLLRKNVLSPFLQGATLDLALYETLNALWKEYKLLKRIDEETLNDFVNILCKIFKILELYSIRGLEKQVLDMACKEKITIYDSAYLVLAISKNAILVTDDRELAKVAERYVRVLSSEDLRRIVSGSGGWI